MLQQEMLKFALQGAGWVLWLLVALSVLCVAISLERAVRGAIDRSPPDRVLAAVQAFVDGAGADETLAALRALRGEAARVAAAGVEVGAAHGPAAAEEAIAAALTAERIRLERGLIVLGTTGANAPFVGLFGTVLGIIQAFHELSLTAAEAAAGVMSGISEALVATGVGLMVAIPAVVLYNAFQRRNRERLARAESLAHLVLARLKERPAAGTGA